MSNGTLFSLAGRARVGKGTFVALLGDILSERHHVVEVAFATVLKRELDLILTAKYGISAFTTNDAEKKVIRPHLVERGAGARAVDPNHWIKLAEPTVVAALNRGDVVVVSDSRYRNECDWIHSLGGKVIYIERTVNGVPIDPANLEEATHDLAAKQVADHILSWPTFGEDYLTQMRPYVLDAWNRLIQPT